MSSSMNEHMPEHSAPSELPSELSEKLSTSAIVFIMIIAYLVLKFHVNVASLIIMPNLFTANVRADMFDFILMMATPVCILYVLLFSYFCRETYEYIVINILLQPMVWMAFILLILIGKELGDAILKPRRFRY